MATTTDAGPDSGSASWFVPDWALPAGVHALQTIRSGGASRGPWASFNLGDHVGDAAADVAANRARLSSRLPASPVWLSQVHGVAVACLDELPADMSPALPPQVADAAVASRPGGVCAVMTADCLPILLCDRRGQVVAAAHAGWRGLCAGVVEATVAAMAVPGREIMAWLGPAIGPAAFEVGSEVREAFVVHDAAAASCFVPGDGGRWLADLYGLARQRLQASGVVSIAGGTECTFSQPDRYFSYRRDGVTGRMASLIWREPASASIAG